MSKIPITLCGYQSDPYMNLFDPPSNFKLMSDFKLTNISTVISDLILSKLPAISNVPIVSFMQILDKIDNEYYKSFPLWLITVTTICFTLVASPPIFLDIWWKCAVECNKCIKSLKKRSPQECPTIEFVPIAS